jgi:uncharacterized protein YgbK (DUF1537 family)
LDELGSRTTIVCPAYPDTGRTVYQGQLFLFDTPLHESGMKDHPLTPMTDANLIRLMGAQTKKRVALLPWPIIHEGAEAVHHEIMAMKDREIAFIVADVLHNDDLLTLGEACRDMALVTGGSGIAMGLAHNLRTAGLLTPEGSTGDSHLFSGPTVILSGSCSTRTLEQVELAQSRYPSFRLDPRDLADDFNGTLNNLRTRILENIFTKPTMVYASAPPEEVIRIKKRIGSQLAGELVERAMGKLAALLYGQNVTCFVVAGGETSGAVVSSLGVKGLRIGPEIDPGVPWTVSMGEKKVALALKSGNFGAIDFFSKAINKIKAME